MPNKLSFIVLIAFIAAYDISYYEKKKMNPTESHIQYSAPTLRDITN